MENHRLFKGKRLGICSENADTHDIEAIWEGCKTSEPKEGTVLEILVGGKWIEAVLLRDSITGWYWCSLLGGWKLWHPGESISIRINEEYWPGRVIVADENSELGWRFAD